MAWIYLAESGDSQSPSENGSDQSPTARLTPIVKESSSIIWLLAFCPPHRFGQIFEPLELGEPVGFAVDTLTSSMEGSHARTLALQDMEKAWKVSEADWYSRSFAWPKKSSPIGYFLKTCQPSRPEEELGSLKKLSKWGMTFAGVLYPLRPLERYIVGKGGSYLPTPSAVEGGPIPPGTNYRQNQRSYNQKTGKHVQITLRRWVQIFPTPCARDYRSGKQTNRRQNQLNTKIGGLLNPQWVEWLMGYPIGYTELEDWAMQWFLNKRKKRSKS